MSSQSKRVAESMRFHFDKSSKKQENGEDVAKRNSQLLADPDAMFFKKPRTSLSATDDVIPNSQSPPRIVNKSLNRVRDQSRKNSISSSPSIMKAKKITPNFSRNTPDSKSLDSAIDDVFNQLKKPEEHSDNASIKYEKEESAAISNEIQWGKINVTALAQLKANTANFRPIIEELKKANEKILEVRRALGISDV